jgi:hypothetical protein
MSEVNIIRTVATEAADTKRGMTLDELARVRAGGDAAGDPRRDRGESDRDVAKQH